MRQLLVRTKAKAKMIFLSQGGMELVQVAILVAIAIIIGLLFKEKIVNFVEDIFSKLSSNEFTTR